MGGATQASAVVQGGVGLVYGCYTIYTTVLIKLRINKWYIHREI